MNVPFRNLTDEDLVEVELPKTGEEERGELSRCFL